MRSYVEVEAEPNAARALAQELDQAAEAIESPLPPDDLLPGLEIVLTAQPNERKP